MERGGRGHSSIGEKLHVKECRWHQSRHGMVALPSINYRLWPCRNRPREGPENLAKIETLAMGFLATPKVRSARSLASGLYARVSTPHQHTIGMQAAAQLREFLERRGTYRFRDQRARLE